MTGCDQMNDNPAVKTAQVMGAGARRVALIANASPRSKGSASA